MAANEALVNEGVPPENERNPVTAPQTDLEVNVRSASTSVGHELGTVETTTSNPGSDDNTNEDIFAKRHESIDTQPLNGLRGLLSIHIMIFHTLIFNDTFRVNILGSVGLTLFFLISGFVLALNDGKKANYKRFGCCGMCNKPSIEEINDDKLEKLSWCEFMQRRAARVLPMYFLSNAIIIPLFWLGYSWTVSDPEDNGSIIPALALTFTVSSTWYFGLGNWYILNGPAWFVCTIWCLYFFFPFILTKYQYLLRTGQVDIKKLRSIIVNYFILNLVIPVVCGVILFPIGWEWLWWWAATFSPQSRFTVFVMGVIGGLIRLTGYDIPVKDKGSGIEIIMDYSQRANRLSIIFIAWWIVGSICDTLTSDQSAFNFTLQVGLAMHFLEYIYVLTKLNDEEKKTNKTYRFLTHKIMLFLGRISYGVYLLHMVIMQWNNLIIYGPQSLPQCADLVWNDEDYCDEDGTYYDDRQDCCEKVDQYSSQRTMPAWSMVFVWIESILLAWFLYKFFEEPMRKCMRPKKQ